MQREDGDHKRTTGWLGKGLMRSVDYKWHVRLLLSSFLACVLCLAAGTAVCLVVPGSQDVGDRHPAYK
jgi:hypothetical protein